MPLFVITRKSDSVKVYEYFADNAIEWVGFEFVTHNHTETEVAPVAEQTIVPAEWYINVGSFYDRFGAYKIPILASSDALVQAVIKDTAVRKYIDLHGRKAELSQAIMLLQSKGFAVDSDAILNVKPDFSEVYTNG